MEQEQDDYATNNAVDEILFYHSGKGFLPECQNFNGDWERGDYFVIRYSGADYYFTVWSEVNSDTRVLHHWIAFPRPPLRMGSPHRGAPYVDENINLIGKRPDEIPEQERQEIRQALYSSFKDYKPSNLFDQPSEGCEVHFKKHPKKG